jgi:hypothetical protein
MQQIRIVDDPTRTQGATRVPETENMRLTLSEHPDQTWIARLRQLVAATPAPQPSRCTWRAPCSCSRARTVRICRRAGRSSDNWSTG